MRFSSYVTVVALTVLMTIGCSLNRQSSRFGASHVCNSNCRAHFDAVSACQNNRVHAGNCTCSACLKNASNARNASPSQARTNVNPKNFRIVEPVPYRNTQIPEAAISKKSKTILSQVSSSRTFDRNELTANPPQAKPKSDFATLSSQHKPVANEAAQPEQPLQVNNDPQPVVDPLPEASTSHLQDQSTEPVGLDSSSQAVADQPAQPVAADEMVNALGIDPLGVNLLLASDPIPKPDNLDQSKREEIGSDLNESQTHNDEDNSEMMREDQALETKAPSPPQPPAAEVMALVPANAPKFENSSIPLPLNPNSAQPPVLPNHPPSIIQFENFIGPGDELDASDEGDEDPADQQNDGTSEPVSELRREPPAPIASIEGKLLVPFVVLPTTQPDTEPVVPPRDEVTRISVSPGNETSNLVLRAKIDADESHDESDFLKSITRGANLRDHSLRELEFRSTPAHWNAESVYFSPLPTLHYPSPAEPTRYAQPTRYTEPVIETEAVRPTDPESNQATNPKLPTANRQPLVSSQSATAQSSPHSVTAQSSPHSAAAQSAAAQPAAVHGQLFVPGKVASESPYRLPTSQNLVPIKRPLPQSNPRQPLMMQASSPRVYDTNSKAASATRILQQQQMVAPKEDANLEIIRLRATLGGSHERKIAPGHRPAIGQSSSAGRQLSVGADDGQPHRNQSR